MCPHDNNINNNNTYSYLLCCHEWHNGTTFVHPQHIWPTIWRNQYQWPVAAVNEYIHVYMHIYIYVLEKKNIQTIQLLTISIHTIQIQYNIRKVYVIIFVMAITRQPYTHNYHVYIYTYRHVVWFNNVLNRFNCHWLIGQIETDHSAGQPWIIIIIIMNKWCASPFLLCYNN